MGSPTNKNHASSDHYFNQTSIDEMRLFARSISRITYRERTSSSSRVRLVQCFDELDFGIQEIRKLLQVVSCTV